MTHKMNTVVIVGRMNVGKSTLFNRLAPHRKSITLDYPGVTRDVIKDTVSWADTTFELIDTGGINVRKTHDELFAKVREKALAMIENAEVVLLVVDGTAGVVTEDLEIARLLHKMHKKVIVVVNKADAYKAVEEHRYEFEQLPHKPIIFLSAEHGTGINELLDAIIALLPHHTQHIPEKIDYKVAFIGRPNVGKSSLLNALLQEERSIVSAIAGTTREAVAERIAFYKDHIELIDTPGVRRKRSVTEELESLMVKSSFAQIKDADIVVLLLDVTEAVLANQELKLAFYGFTDHYKGLIILLNKTDLMTEALKTELDRSFDYYKQILAKIPVLSISCKTGKNIGRVLPLIKEVWERYSQKFSDEEINRVVISALQKKPLFHIQEYLRLYRAFQLSTAPITIGMEVNEPDWFGPSQLGFFENVLRKHFDLKGVPIKFVVRKQFKA
ncbi:MAG: ribosome biogenesis GTPase Der [Candidatus Babeliaceae bacterium]